MAEKGAGTVRTGTAGQRVGYVRASSVEQNLARQLDGLHVDRMFSDHISGARSARPSLDELRRYVRDGDTVVVHSMDRLARNLDDLRALVQQFTAAGVRVEFVKEGLIFSGENSPMSTLLLSVMGAFAEFERALIRERQREGVDAAKARGVYRGRKPALSAAQAEQVRARAAAGEKKTVIARDLGVSRETVYQALRAAS